MERKVRAPETPYPLGMISLLATFQDGDGSGNYIGAPLVFLLVFLFLGALAVGTVAVLTMRQRTEKRRGDK